MASVMFVFLGVARLLSRSSKEHSPFSGSKLTNFNIHNLSGLIVCIVLLVIPEHMIVKI